MEGSTADTAWVTSAGLPNPVGGADGASRWATVVLEPDTASVARARRWARETVEAWHADGQEWTISQLLTEVVTNAVLHADTRFRVRLQQDLGTRRLRCEVTDASAVRPRVRQHSAEATTGRGLQMVADLAQGWGVVPVDGGKTVWFEIEADADLRRGSDTWGGAEPWPASPAAANPAPPTPDGPRSPASRAQGDRSPQPQRTPSAARLTSRAPQRTTARRRQRAA